VALPILAVAILGTAGCDNPSGPSEPPSPLAGGWSGSVFQRYGSSMQLRQAGGSIGGTWSFGAAGIRDRAVTGTYLAGTRSFQWSAPNGCERWSGVLTLDAAGRQLNGTVSLDGRGCVPQVRDDSGPMVLDKQ
jgi:hypothetical protein